jgi:hypothetical protein
LRDEGQRLMKEDGEIECTTEEQERMKAGKVKDPSEGGEFSLSLSLALPEISQRERS